MVEENTKDLTQDEKLDLILSRLSNLEAKVDGVDARLTSLEAKVDERLHDTRPIWEVINARTEKLVEQYGQMAETLRLIEKQMGLLNKDVLRVRAEQEILEGRVDLLEQRPS